MPRLIQQDVSEERRGEERRGVGGGREGCDGGTGKGSTEDANLVGTTFYRFAFRQCPRTSFRTIPFNGIDVQNQLLFMITGTGIISHACGRCISLSCY